MKARIVTKLFPGRETRDGAGVRLRRIFAHGETELLDPFLLLDAFGSKREADYIAGFPWHPHRGIETVTFMLDGTVRHGDSLGNGGVIGPGDLQWMSAGSGIIHEEMPQPSPDGVRGLQLWVNLPRTEKMRDPAYRDAKAAEVPTVEMDGAELRPLAGAFGDTQGPLTGISRDPAYFDIALSPGASLLLPTPPTQTAFIYVYEGGCSVEGSSSREVPEGNCALLGSGDELRLRGGSGPCRLVFARAEPLHESVAWGGPIVMNTREELELAFRELDEGTFIKAKRN